MIDAKKFNKIFDSKIKTTKNKVDKVYRLYYNKDTKKPITYSMGKLEGDFITVTKDQYAQSRYDIIINNERIENIQSIQYVRKLVPNANGISCHHSNVLIVDKSSNSKWKVKTIISS